MRYSRLKIYNFLISLFIFGPFTLAQTIINTEYLMINAEHKFSHNINFKYKHNLKKKN